MNVYTFKLVLSVILIVVGVSLAVVLTPTTTAESTEGIIIDFGDYETTYVSIDSGSDSDALSALRYACAEKGYALVADGESVYSIDSRPLSTEVSVWDLYVIALDSNTWTKTMVSPSDITIKDYKAVAWGLCKDGELPAEALDASGVLFYGYDDIQRVVSLAPSCTETICAVGGFEYIVGTDMYSNYPESVVIAQDSGKISLVGGYTNPSYELVLQLNPDLVICITSQYAHVQMAEKLRASGIDVIMTYDGEDMETIYTNTHMVGAGMGLEAESTEVTQTLRSQVNEISDIVSSSSTTPRVMMALSSVKSPWVSGSGTYISDILYYVNSSNVFDGDFTGWKEVSSESIAKYNPQYIIVQSEVVPTLENYQNMMNNLPKEWKITDAYKNGNIYMFTESALDLSSRASTRLPQMTEITARILHPQSFDDDVVVPKYIGDDYVDYLTYTKTLN